MSISHFDLASMFCQDERHIRHLAYIHDIDSFALYDDGHFKIMDEREFSWYVLNTLQKMKSQTNLTMNKIKDIIEMIASICYKSFPKATSEYVAFSDKLVNMNTNEVLDFSDSLPVFHKMNYSSEEIQTAECPLWKSFLKTVLVDENGVTDELMIQTMKELFGYYLSNTLEAEAAFFLVGEGNNGKSVTLDVLSHIIGERYINAATIERLTVAPYSGVDLIGKKVNICNEEESAFVKSDKFKALVTGNAIQVERKFGRSFKMHPTVKYIFATNELPTFSGLNEGLLRRIYIIPYNKRITKEERDTQLAKKLFAETPGIIRWALEGNKQLKENKYFFTTSPVIDRAKQDFTNNLSSALLFFNERFEWDTTGVGASTKMLYSLYILWCDESGKKRQSLQSFERDLSRFSPKKMWTIRSVEGYDEHYLPCKEKKGGVLPL